MTGETAGARLSAICAVFPSSVYPLSPSFVGSGRKQKNTTPDVLCLMARGVGGALPAANLIMDFMGVCEGVLWP